MSNPTVILDNSESEDQSNPNSTSSSNYTGTVVEGVDYTKESINAERKVVGFLVSYSRKETGEFWPIYMGKNKIGAAPENDIVLSEASVSRMHGELVVRLLEDEEDESLNRLVFILSDSNSSSGTKVNGIDLFKSNMVSEVKHGDMLKIGRRYTLLLFCVDTSILGLGVEPKFQELQNQGSMKFDYSKREPNETRIFGQ